VIGVGIDAEPHAAVPVANRARTTFGSRHADMRRWQDLLDKRADSGALTPDETTELARMRSEADCLTLRKAHAAALLRWRGHVLPPAESLS
jgi:hypothetical protein